MSARDLSSLLRSRYLVQCSGFIFIKAFRHIDHDDKDEDTSHFIFDRMIGGTVTSSKNHTVINVIYIF